MDTWKVISAVLGLAAAGAGWAWQSESGAHLKTSLALRQAEARLSAKVEPEAARSNPTTPPCPVVEDDPTVALTELSAQLTAAEEDRDRYRAGLEQAVAELNRVSGRNQAATELVAALAGRTAAPAPSSRTRGKVVPLADPWLTPVGDQMTVSGKLYNVGDADTEVTCVLELLRDGERLDSARFVMRVAAGATQPYSQTFRFKPGLEGSYTARLTVE